MSWNPPNPNPYPHPQQSYGQNYSQSYQPPPQQQPPQQQQHQQQYGQVQIQAVAQGQGFSVGPPQGYNAPAQSYPTAPSSGFNTAPERPYAAPAGQAYGGSYGGVSALANQPTVESYQTRDIRPSAPAQGGYAGYVPQTSVPRPAAERRDVPSERSYYNPALDVLGDSRVPIKPAQIKPDPDAKMSGYINLDDDDIEWNQPSQRQKSPDRRLAPPAKPASEGLAKYDYLLSGAAPARKSPERDIPGMSRPGGPPSLGPGSRSASASESRYPVDLPGMGVDPARSQSQGFDFKRTFLDDFSKPGAPVGDDRFRQRAPSPRHRSPSPRSRYPTEYGSGPSQPYGREKPPSPRMSRRDTRSPEFSRTMPERAAPVDPYKEPPRGQDPYRDMRSQAAFPASRAEDQFRDARSRDPYREAPLQEAHKPPLPHDPYSGARPADDRRKLRPEEEKDPEAIESLLDSKYLERFSKEELAYLLLKTARSKEGEGGPPVLPLRSPATSELSARSHEMGRDPSLEARKRSYEQPRARSPALSENRYQMHDPMDKYRQQEVPEPRFKPAEARRLPEVADTRFRQPEQQPTIDPMDAKYGGSYDMRRPGPPSEASYRSDRPRSSSARSDDVIVIEEDDAHVGDKRGRDDRRRRSPPPQRRSRSPVPSNRDRRPRRSPSPPRGRRDRRRSRSRSRDRRRSRSRERRRSRSKERRRSRSRERRRSRSRERRRSRTPEKSRSPVRDTRPGASIGRKDLSGKEITRTITVNQQPHPPKRSLSPLSQIEPPSKRTPMPSSLMADPPRSDFNAFCPICCKELQRVQKLPLVRMTTLRDHVHANHFPWYLCVTNYDTKRDGTDARRTVLADQLHPVLVEAMEGMSKIPLFFAQLWGKMLQGFLLYLTEKLALHSPSHLESSVIIRNLYPSAGIITDANMSITDEEKVMMRAHQVFLNDGMKVLEIAPPNCLSSVLHWITLVNLICQLPEPDRKVSRVSYYNHTNFFAPEVPPVDKSTYSSVVPVLVKFWEYVLKSDIAEMVEILIKYPKVLKERHWSGVSSLQLALSKKCYNAARVMLFYGADVDEQDRNEMTSLSRAAKAGDVRAAQLVLAWGAKAQWKKAMVFAQEEGNNLIFKMIKEAADVELRGARPKISEPPRSRPRESIPAAPHPKDPYVDKVRKLVSHEPSMPEQSRVPRTGKPPPKPIKMTLTGGQGQKLFGKPIKLKPPQMEPEPMELDSGDEQSEPQRSTYAMLCEICMCRLKEGVDMRTHFITEHLPWYLGVDHLRDNTTELGRLMMPCLHAYVLKRQVPFEFFAKCWGKLVESFLLELAKVLSLSEPSDLVWYVTRKKFIPGRRADLSQVEKLMVKCHRMYLGEEGQVVISPPNCSSAVLHWTCLFNIFGKLTWQQRMNLTGFEAYKDIEPLKRDILPRGFSKTLFSGKSELLRRKEFWSTVEKGDMDMLWKILIDNRKFVLLSGSSNDDFSPVQAALSRRHPMVARLLLFYGSPPEMKDSDGFTPLWRAASDGKLDDVVLLLPWASKEQRQGAIGMAKMDRHNVVVEVIENFVGVREKKPDKRASGGTTFERIEGKKPPQPVAPPAVAQPSAPRAPVPAAVPYTPASAWQTQAQLQTSQYSQYSPQQPAYGGTQTYAGAAIHRPPLVRYPTPAMSPASQSYPRQPQSSYSYPARPAMSGYQQYPQPVPRPVSRPMGAPRRLPTTYHPQASIYQQPRAPPPVPGVTNKLAASAARARELREVTLTKQAAVIVNSPSLHNIQAVTITPGKIDFSCQSFLITGCPICGAQYKSVMDMKYHVVTEHLPWYFALKFYVPTNTSLSRSTLAKQLLPVLQESFTGPCKVPPFAVFFRLLGKLVHGFLEMIAKLLGLVNVQDLQRYVVMNKFYPNRAVVHTPDEKLLFQAHKSHTKDISSDRNLAVSPPNCLSTVLHWSTIANLISRFPLVTRDMVQTYEGYTGKTLLPRNPPNKSVSAQLILRMQRCISDNNLYSLHDLLEEYPKLANVRIVSLNGISPLEFALGLVSVKTPQATILALFGADTDHQNNIGSTALKNFSRLGNVEAVKFLVNWGASKQSLDSYEAAFESGHEEICTFLLRELPMWLEGKVKPPSQIKRISEMSRQAKAGPSKTGRDAEREHVTGIEACPLCDYGSLSLAHVATVHLPWYASLQFKVPNNTSSLNTTNLSMLMTKMVPIHQGKRLPRSMLQIIGKLLYDMFEFIKRCLNLNVQKNLVEFVVQNNLWDESMNVDNKLVLDNTIIPAYQQYAGESVKPQYSPPNCVAVLAHWRTLTKLISKLFKHNRKVLLTYETFSWSKKESALPYMKGPVKQPPIAVDDQTVDVRDTIKQHFMTLITEGFEHINVVYDLLHNHPSLVYCKSTNDKYSVIAHVLFLSKFEPTSSDKALLFKTLVLAGAPIDMAGPRDRSALHIAANKNDLFAACLLLQWGVDLKLKDEEGLTASDIAKKEGHTDIYNIIGMAMNGKVRQYVAYTTYIKMLGKSKDAGWNQPSKKKVLGKSCSKKLPWECPICFEKPFTAEHAIKSHLPWYAGLSVQVPFIECDKRRTVLYMRLCRGLEVGTKKDEWKANVPDVALKVIGKLLHEMLKFMAESLKLSSIDDLLEYVADKGLWTGDIEYEVSVHALVMREITMAAHQAFLGKPDKVTVSPPNCPTGLLHWRTLLNIADRMSSSARDKLVTLELFQWDKHKPALPCPAGLITQPIPPSGYPPNAAMTFMAELKNGRYDVMARHLVKYPHLVFHKIPSSTLLHGLVNGSASQQTLLRRLATALLLQGAPLDAVDDQGYTVLHYAVRENKIQVIITLLLWGADHKIKGKDGWAPYDIAKTANLLDICTILEAVDKGELMRVAAIPVDILQDGTVKRATDETFTLPTLPTAPVQSAKKPASSKQKEERDRSASKSKSTASASRKTCPVCDRDFSPPHVFRNHLPWYAGISRQFTIHRNDPRATIWSYRLTRALTLRGKSGELSIPYPILVVMGKLLNDLLLFMADSLGMKTIEDLVTHVKAKKLHPKRLENWETVQFEVSVAAYEAYSGTKEVVFVAPPNCIAGLLHWETLWNITLQLPQAAMKKVVTYDDGLQWSPTNPVLPYAKGDVAQPAKSTKHPTPELEQQFLLALGNGIIPKVSSLMNKYPALAICQSGPTVLTQALIFNKNTQLPGKIRLAATLMLQGARLEATDMKGYTVLHHAVKSCQCPLVRILLAWGANMEAQSSTGVTPYDMAVQENFLEIVQLFDNVKKNGVKHAAESIFKADKASGKGSSKDRTAEKCLLCDNKDFVMTHCMRNHLPWYAGLQCNVPPTVYDERRTHLYLMLMRGRTLKNKSSSKQTKLNLPDYYLPIFGRLLYDMLDFMAVSLGLSCGEDLLQYVLDNDLYCTTEQDHGDHSSLYFGYLASALQFYTETEEREIIYSPPNCAAALLRWDHLMVIASKMPTADREALINFEKYKWDPENPTLPTKQGLKPLPLPDREGLPPLSLNQKSDFMTLIKDSTRESQVTGLVVDQPSYVWSIGKKPLAVGVVTQALVFNVEATGANMTRLLLLSGARINRKDLEGYTALHHAVMKNQLQSVILLLLWGANWTIRANDDHTPKSLARKHVRDDMLKMFDMAERADFARIAAIPLLTLEDETTKKPVSVFQRIIMHRKPRDKKSADDDGEDEACYEPCAMCDKPFGVQHVSTTHLPWYAGLHAMIRPDVEDCRRTALSSVMLRGMKTIKGRVHLPDEFLQIIGKLLHGLLEALTKALKLGTRNELLRYVLDNQLWPKNSTKQHDDVLSSVTTNSYQQYTGLKAPVVYSPPNCVAGLLHWETLYNLISKLEKSDQEVTLMYESYSWNARNPALPSPRGSIHQPQTTDKSSANVPKEVINAFVSNLSIGNALGVSDCLEKYPALVFHKVRSKLSCGVVSKALIFNSVSKPSVRFEMAKVLLLRGAPIDDVDIKGNTALHHAILSKKFSFQMVIFLLLWGADTSVKDASGKRPRDLAKKLGYKDICAIFDMHDSGKIAEITRITPDVYEDRTSIGQKTVLGPIAPVKTGWLCPVCHTATDYHRHHALEKHLPWYVSAGFDYLHLVTNKRITRLSDCVLPSLVTVAQCKDLSPVAEKKTDAALVSCFVSLLGQLHQGLLQYIAKELKLNGISDILSYVKVNGLAPKSEEELKPVDKYAIKCYQLFIDDEPSSTTVAPPSHTSALLYWETLLNLIAKLPARCHREVLSYERYEIPRTKCSVRTMLIEGNVRLKMSLPPTTGITEEVQQKFTQAILTSNLVQLSELLDEWPNLVYVPQETSKMSPVALAVSMKKYNVPGVLFLHGASPDQIDVNGQTALHRAVKKCSWKSVEILLTLGAKSDLPNPLGTTALALAQRKNDSQTLLAFARVDQQKERAILCRADVIVEKAREDVIEGLVMEGIDGIIESRRKAIEKAIEIRQWKIGSGTNKPTKKWVCPLCSTETSAARYHAAAHLPWFTCILGGKPQEQHTSVLCKMLLPILAHDVYDNDRLPADVFVMAWGELWGEFFTYMGRLLGIDSIQGLVDYMETMKIWRGPEYASSCTDKFAAMALQRYLNKKGKPLLIKPTTLMDFVHWESVLNLIAEVHESAWESIAQFENFNIKKTECQFAVKQADSKTPGGKRLVEYLASPSLDDISFDAKKELINHVRQGDIKMVCKMLEEEPKLACLPVPHFQDGGLIAWALNNDKRQVAVAARLSGADPDHPNMLGRSSLHTVASRADMDTATFLLDMGASPLTKSFIDDYATPAEVAQKKGDQKMYDFLKKAEIDFTERAKKPVSVVSTDVPKTTRKRRMPRKAAADDTEAVPMHDEEINIIDELIGGGGFTVVDQADETTEVEKGRNQDKTAESNGEAVIVEHVKLSKEAKIKTEPQDPEFDRVEKGKEPAKKAAEAVADTSEKTTEKQIIDIRIKTEPADDVIMAEAAGDNLSEKTPQPTASTSATEAAPNLSIEDEVPADATVFEFAINDTIILDEEEEDTDVEEHSDVEDEQPLDAETWKSYADKAADKTAEEMDMDNFIVLDDLSDQEGTKGEDTAKEAEPMDTKEKSDDDGNKDKQATDAEKMKEKDQIQTKDDETTTKDAQMVDDDAMDLQIIEDDDEDAEKPERNVEESFEDQHDSDEEGVPTMDDMIVLSEEGSDDEDVELEVQEYDEYHSDDDPGSPLQILDPILLSSDSEPEGDDRETMEWGSPIPRQPDSANNASNESSLLQVQGSAGDHAATADDAQTEMQHDVGAGEGPLITNIKKEKETDDYYFASQSITGSTTGTNADNNGDSQVETREINAMLNDETNPTGKEDAIGEQGEEQIMETEQGSSEDAGGGEVSSSVVAPETEAQMHTIEQEKDELNQTETEKAEDSEEQTHMETGNAGQKEVHAGSTEDTPAGEPQDSAVAEETGSQEQNDSAPVAEAEPMETGTGESVDQTVNPEATEEACDDLIKEIDNIMDPETKSAEDVVNVAGQTDDRAENEGQAIVVEEDASAELSSKADEELKTESLNAETESKDVETAAPEKTSDEVNTDTVNAEGGSGEKPEAGGGESTTDEVKEVVQE